ncbi:MAG TPA: hypothetical protein VM662_04155 [Sphingomonas sp.]|nr:hypothetical protein [Sphingomonas sp.]
MADERTEALREMATHRGLRLVSSRRRKPGGDFGMYGLKEPDGTPVFGMEGKKLTASAEEVEAYLRDATRATWGKSAGSVKARPRRKVKSAPSPRPKPRPKLKVENLLKQLPAAKRAEAFNELLARPGVRIERIVSRGQSTPEDAPMVQDSDEWVVLLEGAAGIRVEDSREAVLGPGDHLWIARGQKHWVTWTAKDRPSVWLAVHLD